MKHVMIDLETWGRVRGSAIRSLGAVVFDPATGQLNQSFYRNIDDASCEEVGLTRDPETEAWWEQQSLVAQAALLEGAQPLGDVLTAFTAWWGSVGGRYIYGHGATFDPVLLEGAYHACLLDPPWDFWNVRCCRTILAMANRKPDRRASETQHNALDDARAQARAVAAAFRFAQFTPG